MSGFGKLWASMYDGSLADNWKAMVTFQQMIILADANGEVDMTIGALHRRTGIPVEILEEGIYHLSQPDKNSRSKTEEGRRILPLSEDRDWGWKIVNHAYYRNQWSQSTHAEYKKGYMAGSRKALKVLKRKDFPEGVTARDIAREIVMDVKYTYTYTDPIPPQTPPDPENRDNRDKPDDQADSAAMQRKRQRPPSRRREAKEVLDYMNAVCRKGFDSVDANLDLIIARLNEGYTVQKLMQIVTLKEAEWGQDPERRKYLRPKTLFSKTNCAQYAGECNTAKLEQQKPEAGSDSASVWEDL